jgi:hypothetical protein
VAQLAYLTILAELAFPVVRVAEDFNIVFVFLHPPALRRRRPARPRLVPAFAFAFPRAAQLEQR